MYKMLLCTRYLRTRYIALASIISVMLGVATMIVVNSVMSGFSHEMRTRINGILADIDIETNSLNGEFDPQALKRMAKDATGDRIESISATVEVFGLLHFRRGGQWIPRPVTLVGIDPESENQVSPLVQHLDSYREIREDDEVVREPLRDPGAEPGWELTDEALAYRKEYKKRQRMFFEPHHSSPFDEESGETLMPDEPVFDSDGPGDSERLGDSDVPDFEDNPADSESPVTRGRARALAADADSAADTEPAGTEPSDTQPVGPAEDGKKPKQDADVVPAGAQEPPSGPGSPAAPGGKADSRVVHAEAVAEAPDRSEASHAAGDASPVASVQTGAAAGRSAENPFANTVMPSDVIDEATGEKARQAGIDAPLPGRLYVGAGLVEILREDARTGKVRLERMVHPGDDVKISTVSAGSPPEPRHFFATVVDIYKSGMSEYDSNLVFCNLEYLQEMRGMIDPQTKKGAVTTLKIRLKDYDDAPTVVKQLQNAFPPHLFTVRTWEQKQGPLLAAVDIEAAILNVLLFLIIAVAGFGILAIFYMIVVEKTRDIGILKALGASSRGVMSIFLSYGLALGIVGSGVGAVLGLLFVRYINEIEEALALVTGRKVFDERIYYFPSIPTQVNPWMVLGVAAGAIVIAVLASVLPARRAARLHPVQALRYE